jgi:hypothetical protein
VRVETEAGWTSAVSTHGDRLLALRGIAAEGGPSDSGGAAILGRRRPMIIIAGPASAHSNQKQKYAAMTPPDARLAELDAAAPAEPNFRDTARWTLDDRQRTSYHGPGSPAQTTDRPRVGPDRSHVPGHLDAGRQTERASRPTTPTADERMASSWADGVDGGRRGRRGREAPRPRHPSADASTCV